MTMDCTHPVLYSRNCVLYCQICGAVIDPPKVEKPLEGATQAATDGFERPSGRKAGFDVEKPKRRTRKTKAD
jgi:hypothetical protein